MLLLEDEQLLRRFRAGDRDAMTTVFNHYADDLAHYLARGFAYRAGGELRHVSGVRQRSELHDVLAETFRKAFEERARLGYSGLSPYGAYLRTIARNIIVDRQRRGAREQLGTQAAVPGDVASDGVERELADEAASAAETLEQVELGALMTRFFAALDSKQRHFVELRFRQGLSQEQVASQLRISRKRVRKLEQTLRARLLEALRGTGYLAGVRGLP
ncbi:MAG: sigma-70 family RNA polymerase sigma factor [Myxococcales bacterium]|nr:sigma-70 family RNA polymerase sigma factor [Myxococcales bacterium]